jgi:threonine dehydrogenase-like Zn-dependent dehydrogenase
VGVTIVDAAIYEQTVACVPTFVFFGILDTAKAQKNRSEHVVMYKVAIVGLGPAGILALALLPDALLREHGTLVLEHGAVGGDLATRYSAVVANVPKSTIVEAFRKVPRWAGITEYTHFRAYADDQCPLLADAVKQLRVLAVPDIRRVDFRHERMTQLVRRAEGGWTICSPHNRFYAERVILCTGARPRMLDLPVPAVPLEVALSPAALEHYVRPEDRIVIFGTSHSGTLVCKNLRTLGCKQVTAVHTGDRPFRYAREGVPEGIKQESAAIADAILARAWGDATPTLLPYDDFSRVYRAVHAADLVIYAIGFDRPALTYIDTSGNEIPLVHDPVTSQFTGAAGLFGFGIGFPSYYRAPDGKQYYDVGFAAFIQAIQAALPAIAPEHVGAS